MELFRTYQDLWQSVPEHGASLQRPQRNQWLALRTAIVNQLPIIPLKILHEL